MSIATQTQCRELSAEVVAPLAVFGDDFKADGLIYTVPALNVPLLETVPSASK